MLIITYCRNRLEEENFNLLTRVVLTDLSPMKHLVIFQTLFCMSGNF